MSKGNQVIPFRCEEALLSEMDSFIRSRNRRSREEPWTRSDLIKKAIRELLSHRKRRPKGGKGENTLAREKS